MECNDYRIEMEMYTLKGISPGTTLEKHLASCSSCMDYFKRIKKEDEKISKAMESVPLDSFCLERLKEKIQTKKKSPKGFYLIGAAAVIIFCFFFIPRLNQQTLLERLVKDAIESHNKEMEMEYSITEDFTPELFVPELAFEVLLPAKQQTDLGIRGARLCSLVEKKVAFLYLEGKGSLFVFDVKEIPIAYDFIQVERDNCQVTVWKEKNTGYCLVY